MLNVTADAAELLSQRLAALEASENRAIRLILHDSGFSLEVDTVRPDDATFSHQGSVVLVIDKQTCESLAANTLDVTDTDDGQKLELV